MIAPAEKMHFDLVGSRSVTQRVDGLWDEFVGWHDFRRQPSAAFTERLRHTLSMVLLNLALSPGSWIAVIGNPDWYQRHKPLLGPLITYASVKKVERFLRKNGYVSFRKGRASGSKSFWRPNAIRATEKLLKLLKDGDGHSSVLDVRPDPSHYPIRLRSAHDDQGNKQFIPFEYSGEHMLMADHLETINKALLRHWPDIEITDEEQRKMLRQMSDRDGDYATLNLGRRTLYRVFNNGTFEDGGRFYGGWWQNIPRDYRPYITINGKQTVEVDYSAIHPTILYDELGIEKPDDPYTIGIGDRELVKKTFNALINAKGPNIRRLEDFSETQMGMSWEQFLEAVKARFAPFKRYFGTGYGLKLQRLDSNIAEAVMMEFAKSVIPILPLHDSFIVHYGYESMLQEVMQKKFEWATGSKITLKTVVMDTSEYARRRSFGDDDEPVTHDIQELLNPTGPFAAYDRRIHEWFRRKDAVGG